MRCESSRQQRLNPGSIISDCAGNDKTPAPIPPNPTTTSTTPRHTQCQSLDFRLDKRPTADAETVRIRLLAVSGRDLVQGFDARSSALARGELLDGWCHWMMRV